MRDIIVIRRKCTFKTAKGHQFKEKEKKKKKKRRKEGETMENSARERGAEFGRNNNIPMAISLESTVGSCWCFDILFFSHSSTNWPERFEGTQSDGNHHLNVSGKQKEIILQSSFGRRPISFYSTVGSCSFLDRWCA